MAEAAPVEVPDWLQEIAPAEPAEPAPAPPVAEAAPAEAPDWLQEIAPAEPAEPAPAPPVAEAAPAEVSDWLQEIAPAEPAEPASAPPVAEAALDEIPDWLREIAPDEGALPQVAPSVPPLVDFPVGADTAEVPEWLSELEAGAAPPAPAVSAFVEEVPPPSMPPESEIGGVAEEELARADIPAWMEAMRPRIEEAEVTAEGPLETEGLLEGLQGLLAPTLIIEAPAVRESAVPDQASEVSLTRAQLLQSLLARQVEAPQPEARKRGVSVGERIQRWLVAVVLPIVVGSILVASQTPRFNIPTLSKPAKFPAADRMYNLIQEMDTSAETAVLVASEYGPAEADELNLVAEPILRHLLDQGACISVVSTRPDGLTVAAGLRDSIIESEEQYTETHYILLDYQPGDATGVSQLLAEVDTPPRLVLVLTAQPGPLRWWVEQTHALGQEAPAIIAGLSAALEPSASPYLDANAGQLTGGISGLSGAAAYEKLCGSSGQATQKLGALAAGHAAIVVLMILGAVFYVPSGLLRRKK